MYFIFLLMSLKIFTRKAFSVINSECLSARSETLLLYSIKEVLQVPLGEKGFKG